MQQARKQSPTSNNKRWLETQSITNAYVFAKICPIFQQKIPIAIIKLISIFHYEFYWRFHPLQNPKYPHISLSNDGQAADDLSSPNSKYKAIYFGPILTYGTQFRCIFEIIAKTRLARALTLIGKLCIVPADYDITAFTGKPLWGGHRDDEILVEGNRKCWNDCHKIEATDGAYIIRTGTSTH